MAATASVTALSRASIQPWPCQRRMAASTTHTVSATTSKMVTSCAMAFCSGVVSWLPCVAVRTISPYRVLLPVQRMRSHAVPVSIRVPAVPQWSSVLVVGSAWVVSMRCLVTGNDSPVSVDSSTCSPWPDTSRPSAGKYSPGCTSARSPGTRSRDGMCCQRPSRSTRAELARRLARPAEEAVVRKCR